MGSRFCASASLVLAGVVLFPAAAGAFHLGFVEAQWDDAGGVDGLAGAYSVAVSGDGAHVYATGFWDHSLAAFARQPNGALAFVEVERDGVGGVEGLANATGLAVSPDGAHLYVAGEGDNAVAVFARTAASGVLDFVEAEVNGSGGVTALAGASAVVVSPEGATVYATGAYDSGLVAFIRDPLSGALSLLEEYRNGQGGVAGMSGPRGLAVSPDWQHVYVAAYGEGAVVSFARQPLGGALTFVEFRNSSWGVLGLHGARSIASSPDGRNLYVAGADDSAVVALVRMLFGDGFEWGTTSGWSTAAP